MTREQEVDLVVLRLGPGGEHLVGATSVGPAGAEFHRAVSAVLADLRD